jgi:flagellar basal-body rod modification protein FlgD
MSTSLSVTTPASPDQLAPSTSSTSTNSLQTLTANDFVSFLVTQLQNQDPLNPTDSNQMLSQLSEIGQLQSTTQLDSSLTTMTQQNQVAAASGMIGKAVQGTDQNNNPVSGNVTSVQVTTSGANLLLDSGSTLSLSNVTSISNPTSSTSTSTTPSDGTTPAS